jgi:hypothetical protein
LPRCLRSKPVRTSVNSRHWIAAILLLAVCCHERNAFGLAGTWTPLNNAQPVYGTALLLTDGSVLVIESNGIRCSRLKPDASGSYIKGTWLPTASMHDSRLYFASVVLPDGRVLVGGGEYGTGRNSVEIYDPVKNIWTRDTSWPGSDIGDSTAVVMPNGLVLLLPRYGNYWFYNPNTDVWTKGLASKAGNDEQSVAQLPDGSFFVPWNASSLRYVPSLDQWVPAATPPKPLIGAGGEIGPATLLYDGRVFCLGANGNTDLYTPPGTPLGLGTWQAGPTIPNGLMCDDAPAAVMPNGHVLFVADAGHYLTPSAIFEYDPVANSYTDVGGPSGSPCYIYRMLVLPTGQVFLPVNNTVYTPVGTPSSSWQPVISSITANLDGSFKVTGTQLNGLTEGAYYGDDAQMSSNYPIVKLVNGSNVYYARSYAFSSMGVATGNASVSASFSVAGIPNGNYSLYVVANGIASNPVAFGIGTGKPFISSAVAANGYTGKPFNYAITGTNSPTNYNATGLPSGLSVNSTTGVISGTPAVGGTFNVTISATNASGTGTALLVLAVYTLPPLITSSATATGTKGYAFNYTNTASNGPTSFAASPLPPGLSLNSITGVISGTPTAAGTYSLTLSATNPLGTGTKVLTLTINPPVLTTIVMSPSSAQVAVATTRQFTATGKDQFGNPLNPQPTFTWTVSGGGTISSTGLFTAGTTAGGPFTVTAASGLVGAVASVTVYVPTLTTISLSPTSANVPVSTTKQFTATGKDQFGVNLATQPVFAWTVSGGGTISASGLFTAGSTSGGPFTVKAASGLVSGTASVTVYVPALASISVSPTSANVPTSGTKQYTATGKDQFGLVLAIKPTYTWTVSGGGSINSAGLFTAGSTAGGPFTIKATSGAVSGTASVTIYAPLLTSISVSPTPANVPTAGTKQYTATGKDQFGLVLAIKPTYTWTVSGGGSISSAGLFTAGSTAGGPFTIKATSGAISGTASVTIYVPVLTSISISPTSATVLTAGTKQFTATGKDQFGLVLAIKPTYAWTVSGGGVFSVSGLFTAGTTAGGPYTVTASSGSIKGIASVTVLPAPSATTPAEGTAPSITSSPVATPNPAAVSQSVLFAVAASNLNDNALIYAWDFGDGSTGSGAQVTHVYSATGTYDAAVTVSDGASSVTAQVIVVVTSSDAANSNTPVSLETVTLGHPFKLQLPWPANIAPAKKVRTTAQGLPRGVRVNGNWIVGRPRQAGTFTISVRFSIKTAGIVTEATEQYTFTVSP